MIVTISGESGSGKTTAGELLAKNLGYKFYSGGYFFRKKAEEYGMDLMVFSRYAEKHPEIDIEEDNLISDFLKSNKNIVFESRLSGYLASKNNIPAFRVYLNASLNTRIKRLMQRDNNISRQSIIERERSEISRYMEFYGIDYRVMSYYNFIIDTDVYKPEEIVNNIIKRAQIS